MILFLFVGCGYNFYYWERFAKKTPSKPTTSTIEENVYDEYEEPLYNDTLTTDTFDQYYEY